MSTDGTAFADFPCESFTILAFCASCGHSGPIDRRFVPQNLQMEALVRCLRCTACGARAATIRIVYTGAGGFHYGGASPIP